MNNLINLIPNFQTVVRNQMRRKSISNYCVSYIRTLSDSTNNRVSFVLIDENGERTNISGKSGTTLRDVIAQHRNGFGDLFYGACDGQQACSTCYVDIVEDTLKKLPEASVSEMDCLDSIPGVQETCRLACAINLTPDLEGMVVKMPNQRFDGRNRYNKFDEK